MAYNPNNPNGLTIGASSAPVVVASDQIDLVVTGQAAQTATVNNILTTTAGAAATNVAGFHSGTIQVTSTGTGGAYIFECSNDNVNFVPLVVYNAQLLNGNANNTTIAPTSGSIVYTFPVLTQYIRLRISSAVTGGSIQAFTRMSQVPWSTPVTNVAQSTGSQLQVNANQTTAANLLCTATIASGTVTTVSTVSALAGGQTANGSANTGNPVRVGAKVVTTLPTAYTNGNAADIAVTSAEQVITKAFGSGENDWQYATPTASPITTTTAVALKAAGAASIRNYCTAIQIFNTSTTVSSIVTVLDGATVIWTGYIPAASATSIQDNSIQVEFPTPLRGTAATAMNFQVNTTAANVFVSAQGYQSF